MLKATNITKSYDGLEILKGVSLEVVEKEVVSIVGRSGAGKSTLLHILGTLDLPDSGGLMINDTSITSLSQRELAQFRNENIGFVFQFHNLLPEFTALENVCIPAFLNKKKSQKEVEENASKLLERLGLSSRIKHKPSQLSGGEQQRVAVARALINSPKIIFADEPSGNLDSKNADELHELIFDLKEEFSQTFVIVTHNKLLAKKSDRFITIEDGIIKD